MNEFLVDSYKGRFIEKSAYVPSVSQAKDSDDRNPAISSPSNNKSTLKISLRDSHEIRLIFFNLPEIHHISAERYESHV